MNEDIRIKKSLAKTLTLKMAVILIGVLLILTIGAYTLVSGIVHDQTLLYNEIIATNYLDAIAAIADEGDGLDDAGQLETIEKLSDYLCDRNYVGFIYTYVVDKDRKHVTVLDVSEIEGLHFIDQVPEIRINENIPYEPTEDELELWNGKTDCIHYDDKFIKNAVVTACATDDAFGNRIVAGVGVSFEARDADIAHDFIPLVIIIFISFIILTVIMYLILRRDVLNPAKKISGFMKDYIHNGHRTNKKLNLKGEDEFAMIAASLNKMTDDIDNYLENIRKLNGEEERQKAELDIAAKIQQGLLPSGTYAYEDGDIYATMKPAKYVGGDFYDYYILEDGRIMIIIADVSGKGIAAALYMAVVITSIRQLALAGHSPADILKGTNETIASNNKALAFITAFIGIYDPNTGEFTYSNAGHNPPYIICDKPVQLTGARNLVLGLYENEPYVEETIKVEPGNIIFLYTDGVTEATNENKEFFGEERLEKVLEDFRQSPEKNIVEYVGKNISEFMNDSEQHDDITMLSFIAKSITTLELKPDTKEFGKIRQLILESSIPGPLQRSLCAAAEEIFINICSYAFEGKSENDEKKIHFTYELSDRVMMRFEDNGIEYDPTVGVQYDIDYDMDTQLGGLGKIIAFTIADEVKYEYIDGKNTLTMSKYLKGV